MAGEIKTRSLASGSSGNAYIVWNSDQALLVDAGVSLGYLKKQIPALLTKISALILTHGHSDHTAHADYIATKLGVPIYASQGTLHACADKLEHADLHNYHPGQAFNLGDWEIYPIATPHDCLQPTVVSLSCNNGYRKVSIGIWTDLGHIFTELTEILPELDAVFLEANYDPGLLTANRKYPAFLKKRIISPCGHISNQEAALLLGKYGHKLQLTVLSHLSHENNRPDLAIRTINNLIGVELQQRATKVQVAPRREKSAEFVIN